jgi:hypothetical protein
VLGVEPDEFEQRLHLALDAVLGGDLLNPERGTDDRADRVPRVQRRVRVLEDHLHVPPQRAQLALRQVGDVRALEDDRTTGRFEEPDEHAARGRLAAAGLADQPQRLSLVDIEVETVDRLHGTDLAAQQPFRDGEVLLQPPHRQQCLAVRHRRSVIARSIAVVAGTPPTLTHSPASTGSPSRRSRGVPAR